MARARKLARDLPSLGFETADGRSLPFPAAKAEARRRVASGESFGHIAYVSLVARKGW